MSHLMKLKKLPFSQIKSGEKTIELRLFDEKRQRIKVLDEIVFTNEKSGESVTLKVSALFRAPDFASLFESVDAKKCGLFSQSPENEMLKYYTKEEIEKYGVLAIALSRTE